MTRMTSSVAMSPQGLWPGRLLTGLLCLEFTLAFFLGGSSRPDPFKLMAVELGAAALLAAVVWMPKRREFWRDNAPALLMLLGLFLIPLAQLSPLPPSIWTSFESHSVALETIRVAGVEPGWRPFSLTPEATAQALLWLLPGASVFLSALLLTGSQRMIILAWLIGLIILSLVVAAFQLSRPDAGLFQLREGRLPSGLFANRNHQAMALVAAMPLSAAVLNWWLERKPAAAALGAISFIGLLGVLAAGVLLTQSRAGLGLAMAAFGVALWIFSRSNASGTGRLRALLVAASAILAVGAALAIGAAAVLGRLGRLDSDARLETWPIVWEAALKAQPLGAGIGSFVSVYRTVEPPALVDPTFANAAHNDYLQLWLEAGLPAAIVLIGFFIWLGLRLHASARGKRAQSALSLASGSVILLMMVHSFVDYPLRTQALACLFGLMCACVASQGRAGDLGGRGAKRPEAGDAGSRSNQFQTRPTRP